MTARQCPQCMTRQSRRKLLALSYGLECASCKSPLEISGASRNFAAFVALFAGGLAVYLTGIPGQVLGWARALLYGFLAFSVSYPLVLTLFADLRTRPAGEVPVVHAEAPHGSGGHH